MFRGARLRYGRFHSAARGLLRHHGLQADLRQAQYSRGVAAGVEPRYGWTDDAFAASLVLVDVAPRVEKVGSQKIGGFMRAGMRGFDTLEDAADSIAAYIPHRPRPKDLSGLRKNLRQRGDGRWYWHWDPRFITNQEGLDGQAGLVHHERLCAAARKVTIPTLLVRGRMSDIVSDESVRELRELIPHAEVVDVDGAGHMVAGDKNDAFNQAVIEFVERSA